MAFGKKPGPPKPAPVAAVASGAKPIMSEANLQALEALNLPKAPQVAPHRIAQRAIPEELFDPNTQGGRLMAALGLSVNDASNVVLTDEAYVEIYTQAHGRLIEFTGRVNAGLPDGVNVAPFLMVPEECWNGPSGDILLRHLKLTPFGSWNVLMLPKDERSAAELGMRRHPGPMNGSSVAWCNTTIGQLLQPTRAFYLDFHRKVEAGDRPDFTTSLDIDERARKALQTLALHIARQPLGDDTVIRSRRHFPTDRIVAVDF